VNLLDTMLIAEKLCEDDVLCQMAMIHELEEAAGYKSREREVYSPMHKRTQYLYIGSDRCSTAVSDIAAWRTAL
jgi:hypothetical protein